MPPITALVHTENDALRLGRCLETLYPCDEILVVDNASRDCTISVAREYGARILAAVSGAPIDYYLRSASRFVDRGWVLCLEPRESLTEGLAASLFDWKSEWKSESQPVRSPADPGPAFSVFLREETAEGWIEVPAAQTRLVPQSWKRWNGRLPVHDPSSVALEGELLRFVFP